jgi:hypothetical protein
MAQQQPAAASGRDWTNQQEGDWTAGEDIPVPFGEDELAFDVPDVVAPADADATIQAQRPFGEIPPGTHELVITGIHGTPTEVYVNSTVKDARGERKVGYPTKKVTLRLAMASDSKSTGFLDIYLPPADPAQAIGYWHGVPEGKKAAGWHAHTFRLLMSSAVAPWPQGQPMPPMARNPKNWIGRRFVGTVDPGDEYVNNAGQTKQGKPMLNQRSFRPAPGQTPLAGLGGQGTGTGGGGNGGPATGAAAAASQQRQQPRAQQPAQAQASQQRPAALAALAPGASDPGGWDM